MTAYTLAEQIAREHRIVRCPIHGIPDCSALLNGCSLPTRLYENALHIATVTEQAVRERIEEEIAATWETFALPLPVNTFPLSEQKAYRFGYLWAARIARGEGL